MQTNPNRPGSETGDFHYFFVAETLHISQDQNHAVWWRKS